MTPPRVSCGVLFSDGVGGVCAAVARMPGIGGRTAMQTCRAARAGRTFRPETARSSRAEGRQASGTAQMLEIVRAAMPGGIGPCPEMGTAQDTGGGASRDGGGFLVGDLPTPVPRSDANG